MKRDMELVRKILFKIEETVDDFSDGNLVVDGYTMEQVSYHCAILYEGGYISDYKRHFADDELQFFDVGRLTWKGHEFLDKIREDTVWNKTKDTIKDKGLPLVFDVVQSVSTGIIERLVKSALGI